MQLYLMKSYLCHHSLLPALPPMAECLQCVPDESPRASWAEGREGVQRSAWSRRLGGRKGKSIMVGDREQMLVYMLI